MIKPSDKIINDVLNNVATKEQAEQVALWFATAEGQVFLKNSMDSLYYKEGTDKDVEFMEKEIILPARKKQRSMRLYRTAAVLIPFIVLTISLGYLSSRVPIFDSSAFQTITTAKGETSQIILQDGTQVFLKPDTSISFPEKMGIFKREVQLKGEAYFEVSSDPYRPFLVELEAATIEVLGTSFNVSSYPEGDRIDVVLNEGNIAFSADSKKENLIAGQALKFNKKTGDLSLFKAGEINYTIGKDTVMIFRDEALEDILIALNRWHNVPFVVQDSLVNQLRYTTIFKNNSLDEILSELEMVSLVKFLKTKDTIFVQKRQALD